MRLAVAATLLVALAMGTTSFAQSPAPSAEAALPWTVVVPAPPDLQPPAPNRWADAAALLAGRKPTALVYMEERELFTGQFQSFLVSTPPEALAAALRDPVQQDRYAQAQQFIQETARLESDPQIVRQRRAFLFVRARRAQGAATSRVDGTTVYSPSECIGAIVNGECHGSILPNSAYHPTCHGEMLNGMCTGPMF